MGNRDKEVLASKIVGRISDYTAHNRSGGLNAQSVEEAINKELKRLQTDYIDLYQIHWPERETNTFGTRDYKHNPDDEWEDNFNEVLRVLENQIKAGKIRHVGVSNEKAWGAMWFLEEQKIHGLTRMYTIVNNYKIYKRIFVDYI